MGNVSKEIEVAAKVDKLDEVIGFLEENLESAGASIKTITQINVSAEEMFVNIASYAYEGKEGTARVVLKIEEEPRAAVISFIDSGTPFDPLSHTDPGSDRAFDEEAVGGFGILMVKKAMDEVAYEYKDGKNIFTMKKNL
ncbi:MAG: ATP-binding protein [Lachnospiraceae bacterium]|nr:ATP-binding protein [Lachnospiraceae bacterium]